MQMTRTGCFLSWCFLCSGALVARGRTTDHLALALSSVAAAFPGSKHCGPKPCKLCFNSRNNRLHFVNGVFRTTVFTDLHYGEAQGIEWQPWGKLQDDTSDHIMRTILQAEKPHLVVFNGDQVTGEGLLAENATDAYDNCLKVTVNSNTPFAAIYGNHDNAVNISHTQLYEHEKLNYKDLSMTQANPDSATDQNGIYNYVLPVFEDRTAKAPSLLLWFFDSRSGIFPNPNQYEDWVDAKVGPWIKSTADCILSTYKLRSLPPSLTFVHIPVSRMKQLQHGVVDLRPPSYRPVFINDDPVDSQGEHHLAVHKPDAPFWTALRDTLNGANENGVIATVVGHDHENDWCAESNTSHWPHCFARHTGQGGYGVQARGSRVIEVRSGLNRKNKETQVLVAHSWIRLGTGEKISKSRLWRA
ncbi:BQ5605_C009g05802 [Microbotryum silenes-dioicae]|uniref:BQ5605_C009g05802 protein n=1 Tax=Microbotryum silenes-dioicae TaxID=796604 RepID=A0A2X0MIR5_9BASI|nr:BQ5605_C009g05802 [Microbotryum silenes-dioicae]